MMNDNQREFSPCRARPATFSTGKLFKGLVRDERGITGAMGLILTATILAVGAIAGLTTVRSQLVQEFGDMAVALERLDQSFDTPYSFYFDFPTTLTDLPNAAPACINVLAPASDEEQ